MLAKTDLTAGGTVALDEKQFGTVAVESARKRGDEAAPRLGVNGRNRIALKWGMWNTPGNDVTVGVGTADLFGGIEVRALHPRGSVDRDQRHRGRRDRRRRDEQRRHVLRHRLDRRGASARAMEPVCEGARAGSGQTVRRRGVAANERHRDRSAFIAAVLSPMKVMDKLCKQTRARRPKADEQVYDVAASRKTTGTRMKSPAPRAPNRANGIVRLQEVPMQRITGFIVLSLTLFLAGLTAVAWVHQEKAQQELMQMERDWCTANSQERCGTPRQTARRRLFGYWRSWDGEPRPAH